jgi:ATP-dependent Lon protease
MPGRIIKAMKQAKVINPLIVLDEIDKMSPDNRGDPAAALLEVLDPEQNSIFHDTFIEENYDLSNVLFICTANYGDRIPHALADRMEIIEVSSYTETEKLHIVKEYLIKKILNNNGIEEKHLKFPDEVIKFIIQHYTMEAGIREAERQINKIARKVVVELEANPEQEIVLTEELVKKYLGKIIYDFNSRAEQNISGVVNGMAYTTAGGDLLPIEVTSYPGKGSFVITGNLKETMRESVQVALGYVRSNAAKFGIGDVDFSNTDIHVHVPSGGIPKDGPSAGVTLTTALISCLNKKPVPANIAMTGEITLRGKVGIIGGVKEKMISAFRGGITEFFIPYDDERFLEDVPKEIRENVEVHLVKDYHEIYNSIFVDR